MKTTKESKHCLNCNAVFVPIRSTAKYCSDECRTAYNNQRKNADRKQQTQETKLKNAKSKAEQSNRKKQEQERKRQLAKSLKFNASTFANYLINECKRAGTIQILEGITLEDLKLLRDIVAKRTIYNGGDSKSYALSHIYPVNNPSSNRIGLLHPENLVIAPAEYNQRRRNKLPEKASAGRSIPISSLRRSCNVDKTTSSEQVLKLIKSVIGPSVYNSFLKEYASKLGLTKINKIKAKLDKEGIKYSSSASFDELQALHLETFGHELNATYKREVTPLKYVISAELNRLAPYSSFKPFIDFYTDIDSWYQNLMLVKQEKRIQVEEFILEQAIKQLHGDGDLSNFEGKPLLSYFSLNHSLLQSPDKYSPFVQLLDSEGRYVTEEELALANRLELTCREFEEANPEWCPF